MTRAGIRTGITLLALAVCSTLFGASGAQGATTTLTGSVAVGGTAFQSKTITIGTSGNIDATLDWDNASANLRMFLYDPTGALVWQSPTAGKPKTLPPWPVTPGNWKIGVKALSGSANYALAVDYPGVQGGGGPAAYSGVYGFSGPAGIYAYGMDWDPTVENAPATGAYNPTDGTGAQGSILVGDYWNYKVQRFSVNGQHLDTYNDVTGPKANGGIPSAPYDIASDPTDQLGGGASFWAADQGSSNFVEFSHSGAWLQTIGKQQSTVIGTDATHPGHSYAFGCGNGQMNVPTHIMVDTVASDHFLYVSDPACRNVYIFNHQGVFQGAADWTGSGVGTPIPRGLAEDAAGNIYVAEYNSRRTSCSTRPREKSSPRAPPSATCATCAASRSTHPTT